LLQDLELEISHQLGGAIRDIDLGYGLTQTNFNRRVAAEAEVSAVQAQYQFQQVTLDLLLDAQRRRAEAESAYYRSLVDYNQSIMYVDFHKGSLLDYDGVYLAEGRWPGKAYFDAMRQARKRDAGLYMDYGYTRPNVVSQGPVPQGCNDGCETDGPQMFKSPNPIPDPAFPSEESLPSPNPSSRMNAPPAGASSSMWPKVRERKVYRAAQISVGQALPDIRHLANSGFRVAMQGCC
jgi:hypothetical protein